MSHAKRMIEERLEEMEMEMGDDLEPPSEPKNWLRPEWSKLREQGWKFVYDHTTYFLGAEHPSGGKITVAEFKGTNQLLSNQLGMTVAHWLNEES